MFQFPHEHIDIAFFYYGLSYVLMAAVSIPLFRDDRRRLPWHFLSGFALLLGLVAWLNLLAIGFGDSTTGLTVRILLLILSFLSLAEFGRRGLSMTGMRVPGPWIHLLFLSLSAMGLWDGIDGLRVTPRYFIGFPASVMASWALFRAAKFATKGRSFLASVAVVMVIFTIISGFFGASAKFFPANILNQDWLEDLIGFRIQDIRAALAIATAFLLSLYYSSIQDIKARGSLRFAAGPFSPWLLPLIVITLTLGWIATAATGTAFKRQYQSELLSDARIISAAFSSGFARLHQLSDSSNASEAKENSRRTMRDILAAHPSYAAIQLRSWTEERHSEILESVISGRYAEKRPGALEPAIGRLPSPENWTRIDESQYYVLDMTSQIAWVATRLHPERSLYPADWLIVASDLQEETGRFYRNRLFPLCATLFLVLSLVALDLAWRRFRDASVRIAHSEQKYRALIEYSPQAVLIAAEYRIRFANASALELFRKDSMDGMDLREIFAERYHAVIENAIVTLSNPDQVLVPLELQILRQDGSVADAEITIAPIVYETKNAVMILARDISERKHAERAFQQSEQRYALLFSESLAGNFVTAPDGRILLCNEAFAHMLGFHSVAEAMAVSSQSLYPNAEIRERFLQLLRERRRIERYEAEFVRRDGSRLYAIENVVGVFDDHDQLVRLEGNIVDISDRKQIEQALRASEDRFRIVSEQTGQIVYDWDVRTGAIVWAGAIQRVTGYSAEEYRSVDIRAWEDMIHPDDRRQAMEVLAAAQVSRQPYSIVYRYRRKDESYIYVEENGVFIYDRQGKAVRMLGSMKDITDRSQVEEKLRASEQKYRELTDLLPICIYESDVDGRVTFANQEAYREFQYTEDEVRSGTYVFQVIVPEDRERALKAIHAVINGELVMGMEYNVQRKDGTCFPAISYSGPIRRDGQIVGIRGALVKIEERKRAEEALRVSEEKFRGIAEQLNDVLYLTDTEGVITYLSPATKKVFGMAPEQMVGHLFTSFLPDHEIGKAVSVFRNCLEKDVTVSDLSLTMKRQDGSVFHGELDSSVIRRDGNVIGTLGVIRDVTARKEAEEALRNSESLLRESQQVAILGSYVFDVRTGFWTNSPVMDEIFGIDRDFTRDVQGWIAIIHPDWRSVMTDYLLNDVIGKGQRFNMDYKIIRRNDGQERWVHGLGELEFDENGKAILLYGTIQDITERKRIEEQIRKLSRAVEQTPSGIMITNAEGVIEYVNASFTRMTGYSFADSIGKKSNILKSGQTPAETYRQLWQTITSGREWRGEFRNRRKNGELYWEHATISPIIDERGVITHYLAMKEDITAQKQADAERQKLEDQLRQAQKMEAIGRLAGGVAHDFNNILTTIAGHSELALISLKQDDPIRPDIEEVIKSADRAGNLTRQLLAFSRRQVIESRPLELNEIIADMERMLGRIIGEDVVLETYAADDLWMIKADRGQIEQVIVNLAVNARDAMPKGGKLRLSTANVTLDAEYCAAHLDVQPGEYVLLEVADTGCGMSDEVKAQVFEPFFTTKPIGSGTGLGLATVYGIVKQGGGHISLESAVDVGTTFSIYLPRTDAAQVSAAQPDNAPPVTKGTEKILVVEDNEAIRETITEALNHFGYEVVAAADAEQALTLCRGMSGQVDLVLSDVILPGVNGLELVSQLKSLWPQLKILLMSGYTDTAVIPSDEVPFIQKPFRMQALAQKVRDVLDAGSSA